MAADGDWIVLDHAVFAALGSGILSNAAFGTSAAMTTAQHILYDQSTGELSYDADGSGAAAIKFAVLTPGTVLNAGHFLVV